MKYSMEKTERVMEKTSNEKIMAINEFSNTVLEQIGKNHKEAVFLYDMLNDKHDKLKNTVSEAMTVEGKLKEELEQAKFSPIQAERGYGASGSDSGEWSRGSGTCSLRYGRNRR